MRQPVPYIIVAATLSLVCVGVVGQAPMDVYTDHLVNGFQDWSWGARDLANPAPVHSGTRSIRYHGGVW